METRTVEMTPEELAELEAFRREKATKAEAERRAADRAAYKQIVDEAVNSVFPIVEEASAYLSDAKSRIYQTFNEAMRIKKDAFGVDDDQKSHTFSTSDGSRRIVLGYRETDGYDDTVNEGIAKVKNYISSLAKDHDSKVLVSAILKLLSKDQEGNLKASRVIQLRKMAAETGNAEFIDGVQIIEDAYRPVKSKQFVIASVRDNEKNKWVNVPLGMTEA